jgi:hypothetical protein
MPVMDMAASPGLATKPTTRARIRRLWRVAGASAGVLTAFALHGAAPASGVAPDPRPGHTALVTIGSGGRLHYQPYSEHGDVLPDFSHCGYGGGGVPLPGAPVKETLAPQPDGDDSRRIQAALDRVAQLPPGPDGIRGAVLLTRGTYRCEQTLEIRVGGVVLRGEGDGPDGTVVLATARRQQPLIVIGGRTPPREEASSRRDVTDEYVPVGARSFRVADARGFAVGDTIFVVRRGNAAWINAIGMDRITPRPGAPENTRQWEPFDLRFDRVITAIERDVVTVDAPLTCAMERRWGGGALVRYQDDRIEHCGVESLRAVSVYDETRTAEHAGQRVHVDEAHGTFVVTFGAVKNAWLRQVTSLHFIQGPASVGEHAKWITIEDCSSLAPVSLITGSRRYPYSLKGQLTLVRRCYSDRARHAFAVGSRVPGPNAFVDCRSENDYAYSEPHHRWSVGGLYDNVESRIAIQDRQWMGTGHGWAGANYVVWNSRGELICQQPPTAQNFAIGFVGRRGRDAFPRPAGWWESEGVPVKPRSLYEQQLRDRLGK